MDITEYVCMFCKEKKYEKYKNFISILEATKCKCPFFFCTMCDDIICKDSYCEDHGDYKDKENYKYHKDTYYHDDYEFCMPYRNVKKENQEPVIKSSRIQIRKIDFTSKWDRKESISRKKGETYPNNKELSDEEFLKIWVKGLYNQEGYFAKISD